MPGGREQQLHRKINWGSHFYERDEDDQERAKAQTLADKKGQEVARHINKCKNCQLRQTQTPKLVLLLKRYLLLAMFDLAFPSTNILISTF